MITTLFSWGYWGWGNATKQLIEATDLAERARGFQQPIFVDIRYGRQGRAKGFVGDALRDLVGPSRYRHIQDLGNQEIATRGSGVRIRNPAAVSELLELAVTAADENRHVIFYCACEFPRLNGMLACHRLKIAELLLAHASKVGHAVLVVEWPGGQPHEAQLKIDSKLFSRVMGGDRKSIPFTYERLKEFAGLPWGSVLEIECEGRAKADVLVGPARFATSKIEPGFWYLPIIESPNPGTTKETLLRQAVRWRTEHGLDEQTSR
jgi:hypothetical protein